MVSPYDTRLTVECQRNGQYSGAIILPMDCHISYILVAQSFNSKNSAEETSRLSCANLIAACSRSGDFAVRVFAVRCRGMMMIFGIKLT